MAMISMDYAFVTPKGPIVLEGEGGWNDPSSLKLLIVKDSKSSSVFAHAVVQQKKSSSLGSGVMQRTSGIMSGKRTFGDDLTM